MIVLAFFGAIRLAIHRLRSRLSLTILSLLGVTLAIGMVVSVPMFAQAVSYLVLRDELADMGYNKNRAPLTLRIYYELRRQPFPLSLAREMEQRFADLVEEKTGLDAGQAVLYIESPTMFLRSTPDGPQYLEKDEKLVFRGFSFVVVEGIEQHIKTVEGSALGSVGRDHRIPVWPHISLCNTMGLQVGETYNLFTMQSDQPIPIYIAGSWREQGTEGHYWGALSFSRSGAFLVTPRDYEEAAQPHYAESTSFSAWYFIPSQSSLSLDKVDAYANGLEILPTLVDNTLQSAKIDVSAIEPMRRYVQRRDRLAEMLVNFSLPAMALLFYFLSLLSAVVAQFQREEMSIMSGRGAGGGFLLGLALMESLVLMVVGVPLGLGAGYLMARLMGQTSGFLNFIDRPGFPVSLYGVQWTLMAAALLLLVLTRLLPAFNAMRRSIVSHLRERSRPLTIPLSVKLAVDVPLIVVTAYAYRQLKQQDVPTLLRIDPRADLLREPLFLLAPLICVLTAALVLSHIFPLVMRPLDALSRRLPWFAVYMGLRRLYSQSGQYTNALFLVIICLSLGAFYSSMALSVDTWMIDRQYYAVGADYAFRQGIPQQDGGGMPASIGGRAAGTWVVPISDYLDLPGVEAATRVGVFGAKAATPRNASLTVRFVGIDRLTFPQAAFFRPDFAQAPLGELMNRLGRVRNGLLVSRQFLKNQNVLEGQRLTLDISLGGASQKLEFVVVGVFDYFPTAYPRQAEALVGNLDYLFQSTGDPSDYRVWLKTSPDMTGIQAEETILNLGVLPIEVGDTRARIATDAGMVERVGIFGVLSIGFIAGSILSWVGLLVYTSASMQGRMQQIGVLKAIGVQTHQALLMEGVEYAGVIIYGVIGGVLSGALASYLFVPFFQFGVTAATALPPFLPLINWTSIGWFAVIFAGALLISEVAILRQASSKDIFQALRMGQRE